MVDPYRDLGAMTIYEMTPEELARAKELWPTLGTTGPHESTLPTVEEVSRKLKQAKMKAKMRRKSGNRRNARHSTKR